MGNKESLNLTEEEKITELYKRTTDYYKLNSKDLDIEEKFLNLFIVPDILDLVYNLKNKDLEDSVALYNKFINYLIEVRPDKFDEKELVTSFSAGKAFLHGRNNKGVLCLNACPRNHRPDECPIEHTLKFQYYWMTKLLKLKKETGKDKICVLADMDGLSMSNFDYGMFWKKHLLQPVQKIFGPMFDSIYIVNSGFIFKTIWYIISPFVSAELKQKIKVLSDVTELKDYFDDENLLKALGGNSMFIYSYSYPYQDEFLLGEKIENDEKK